MEKDLINTAYRAALTSTFTVGYSTLLKKFLNMCICVHRQQWAQKRCLN